MTSNLAGPTSGSWHLSISVSMRVRDFINLDPLVLTKIDPNEDPHNFLDQMQWTLLVMHAIYNDSAKLAPYILWDIDVT